MSYTTDWAVREVRDAVSRMEGRDRRRAACAEEEVNRLALGYAYALTCGAASGRYAPENLLRHCSELLGLIGLDNGEEATREYCDAVVRRYADGLKEVTE